MSSTTTLPQNPGSFMGGLLDRRAIDRTLQELADRHSGPRSMVDELRRRGLDWFHPVIIAQHTVEDDSCVPTWFCPRCAFTSTLTPFTDETDSEYAFAYEIARHLDGHRVESGGQSV